MGKSLRSKIKQKHKSERRQAIYKPVEDARLMRLAEKQSASNCASLPFSISLNTEPIKDEEMEDVATEEPKRLSLKERQAKQRKRMEKLHEKIKVKKALQKEEAQKMMEAGVVVKPHKKTTSKIKPKKLTAKQRLKW